MTEEPDQRVTCTECQRFKAGRCHQAQQAGLLRLVAASSFESLAGCASHALVWFFGHDSPTTRRALVRNPGGGFVADAALASIAALN